MKFLNYDPGMIQAVLRNLDNMGQLSNYPNMQDVLDEWDKVNKLLNSLQKSGDDPWFSL